MEDLTKLSRKEREKFFRKQEIQLAAAKLFAEKGFNNTTLEDIAASAEFGIGTIYNYFQSKEEIFRSIIQSFFEDYVQVTLNVDKQANGLVEFLRIYTEKTFEYLSKSKAALTMLVSYYTTNGSEGPANMHKDSFKAMHCQMDDRVIDRIKKGVENKEIRDVNPQYLYYCYRSMVFPYITQVVKNNMLNEDNTKEHAEFILGILFNGILEK